MKLSAKSEAIAFMIWRVATPVEWNLTAREIADQIGKSAKSVSKICRMKGWSNRIRSSKKEPTGQFMPDPENITNGSLY